MYLPLNIEKMIPSDDPVRLLSAVLEELDYRKLTATYSRFGRIEYSPRLLFKIVLYGCSRGIYKSREIERACRESVNFMYLLEGKRAPDHNTIARFRRNHLPEAIEDLLNQMAQLLVIDGIVVAIFRFLNVQIYRGQLLFFLNACFFCRSYAKHL